jgi:hypothetical protein
VFICVYLWLIRISGLLRQVLVTDGSLKAPIAYPDRAGWQPEFQKVRITMTDPAYITAYQALINLYFSHQASMEEHLTAMQLLKDRYYREGKAGAQLPVVP